MRRFFLTTVPLIPIFFYLCFFFYPLSFILLKGLSYEGGIGFKVLMALVKDAHYLRVVKFTIWQAAVSTLLTVLFAFPSSFIFAKFDFWGKRFFEVLISIPFMLPTIVVATAFQALLGLSGLVYLKGTIWIILLAHIFYNFSLVTRIGGSFWATLSPVYQEAAQVLGANRWQITKKVLVPLLLPAFLAAATLVFLFCFTSFGVILILGGIKFTTTEVEIYRQTVNFFNLDIAVVLSFFQILFTILFNFIYDFLQRRSQAWAATVSSKITRRKIEGGKTKIVAAGYLAAIFLFLVTPLLTLFIRSFLICDGGLGIGCYQGLFENITGSLFFVSPWLAIKNSLVFATSVSVIAVVFTLLVFFALKFDYQQGAKIKFFMKRFFSVFLFLPLGTSSVTLGLGFITAKAFHEVGLSYSPWLIIAAHTVVAFPFVLISVLPKLESINPDILAAARVLGADEIKTFLKVVVPLVKKSLVVGCTYAFLISMGEFGATLIISRPEYATIPVAIRQFLGQPGIINFGRALAMSTILMIVSISGALIMELSHVQNHDHTQD